MSENKYKSDYIFVKSIPMYLVKLKKKKKRKRRRKCNSTSNLKNNLIGKKEKRSKS